MAKNLIQYEEPHFKWLIFKHFDNEIKKGTELLVRPGQEVILCYDGRIADRFAPGRYMLNESSMPRLIAFGQRFIFPRNSVRTDLYFVNTTRFMNNGWGTKDPVICKDPQLEIVRLKAFGTFAYQISDSAQFINTVFGTRIFGSETSETTRYISNTLSQTVAIVLGECKYSILDMAAHYSEIAEQLKREASLRLEGLGVELVEVQVEHIGATDTVNESVDDYTGMQLAKKDFETFERYQAVKSMREAASKPGSATVSVVGSYLGKEVVKIVDKD